MNVLQRSPNKDIMTRVKWIVTTKIQLRSTTQWTDISYVPSLLFVSIMVQSKYVGIVLDRQEKSLGYDTILTGRNSIRPSGEVTAWRVKPSINITRQKTNRQKCTGEAPAASPAGVRVCVRVCVCVSRCVCTCIYIYIYLYIDIYTRYKWRIMTK